MALQLRGRHRWKFGRYPVPISTQIFLSGWYSVPKIFFLACFHRYPIKLAYKGLELCFENIIFRCHDISQKLFLKSKRKNKTGSKNFIQESCHTVAKVLLKQKTEFGFDFLNFQISPVESREWTASWHSTHFYWNMPSFLNSARFEVKTFKKFLKLFFNISHFNL